MPIRYEIDKARRLVLSTGEGAFTWPAALAHQEQLRWDPNFSPDFNQLLDFTRITKIEITPEEVRKLAARSIFAGGSRRAILLANEEPLEMVRTFETLRKNLGEHGIRVFYNRDEALAWIEGAPPK
jgi:hypothetical protein